MIEYIHRPPGAEVQSICSHHEITEEGRMNHQGRILLYVVGVAVIDRSCCGTGGCRFIHVPGCLNGARRLSPRWRGMPS
ncbi:MAG: hypothetical protein C0394_07490 [Syntrophus sp. (in: bacteria)]|nr:hypothetical protein [Syntrophus sp. (in: bacteria)]